jgi:hypothetical protein
MSEQREVSFGEPEKPAENVFRENAQAILGVVESIRAEVVQDPNKVDRKEQENEYVVSVGLQETIEPLLRAMQSEPDAQLILTYGLTRCGKTLSMIKIFKSMNIQEKGSAAFIDMQAFDQQRTFDQLVESISARVNATTSGKIPKLIIIDEMGPLLSRSDIKAEEALSKICQTFPSSTIITIDVFGRNRGQLVKSDIGINPKQKYAPLTEALTKKSIKSVVHPHRDGWLQSSICDSLIALSPDPERLLAQPEVVRRAAKELGAFAMGNPYVMRFLINKFRELNLFEDVETLRQKLFEINTHMLAQPNYLEMNQIYAGLGIAGLGDAFDNAFGGVEYSDMLAKLRVASLGQSEAAGSSLDWASWGRF